VRKDVFVGKRVSLEGFCGRKVAQRFTGLDPLAADYVSWSPYNYVLGNPIMYIDPDGRSVDDIYVNEAGEYLGEDGDTDNNVVRVVSQSTWDEVGGTEGAATAEGTATLQSSENSTLLAGTTKASPGYQKGILISEETWGSIEAAGGERAVPYLTNNSGSDAFVKPEEKVDSGPGATSDAGPSLVKDGESVYGLVDGVATSKYNNRVYKISNFNRVEVTKGGNVSVTDYAGVSSFGMQGASGGWRDMSSFGNWQPLMNKASSIGRKGYPSQTKLSSGRPFEGK